MISRTGAAVLAAFIGLSGLQAEADAAPKKKRPAKVTYQKVDAKAIGELMGPYKFGMTSKEVMQVLGKQIDEKYADRIKASQDVYLQDKLRRDKQGELDRIKKTFTSFKGEKTGWDVSIIDDQFAHNTGESMLIFWENEAGSGKDQRRFFFFQDGKLYKMFIALNSGMLKGEQRTFAYFQSIMEKRYGAGKVVTAKDRSGVERQVSIDWRTPDYHVRAIDKLEFHGSFCLVIADPSVENRVDEMRAANRPPPKKNQVIDAVIRGDGKEPDDPALDENKGAVDAILKGD
jgi:hypothetical protein